MPATAAMTAEEQPQAGEGTRAGGEAVGPPPYAALLRR